MRGPRSCRTRSPESAAARSADATEALIEEQQAKPEEKEAGALEAHHELQPQAVGTPRNPTTWCGTESGHPVQDVGNSSVWSLGGGHFGDPDGTTWIPKFCE